MADTDRGGAVPLDLLALVAFVAGAAVALPAAGVPWPVKWVVGTVFLLVAPGYALVASLFPRRPIQTTRPQSRPGRSRVGLVEGVAPPWTVRAALTLVLSALVVGVAGVALSVAWELALLPSVVTITAISVLGAVVAAVRRRGLPTDKRADPLRHLAPGAPRSPFGAVTLRSVSMIVALAVLVGTVAAVSAGPPPGDGHTDVSVLTESENGTLVAQNHPSTFVAGEGHTLYLGIENDERRTVSYGVAVVAQEVTDNGTVTAQERVDQFETTVADGEDTYVERRIAPNSTGEQLRLRFLVYEGAVPDRPRAGTADHALQLWIDVVEEGAA